MLETSDEDTVGWLEAHSEEVSDDIGHSVAIKTRSYALVAESVPVSFDDNNEDGLRKVEKVSEVKSRCIMKASWLKKRTQRKEGQETADLIIRVKDIESANSILRDGIIIKGKRVRTRKLVRTPKRCYKCQRLGHIAAQCKSDTTICATCSEEHETDGCIVEDETKFRCTNCDTEGHASWDRTCTKYQEAARELEKNTEDSKYKYFRTKEDWTWELNEHERPQTQLPPQKRREREPREEETPSRQMPTTPIRTSTPDPSQEPKRRQTRIPSIPISDIKLTVTPKLR